MDDPLSLLEKVADDVLTCDGDLPSDVRAAAFAHAAAAARRRDEHEEAGHRAGSVAALPEPLGAFVAKVTTEAYRIGDADFDALRAAGYSDDAILEVVLATAVGAGLSRLEVGLAAIAGEG